jgi:methylmalonyl-CoA mutase N-terminal domain/subunit
MTERKSRFITVSNLEIKRLYTPEDIKDFDYERDLGSPGEYPFTRGIYPTMYRGRLWTMRQFAGFGGPEETNRRFKYLTRTRPDRPLHRLRYAHINGAR